MDADHHKAFPTSRMKGESAVAFQAFRAYLDLGDTRTIAKLSTVLHKSTALLGVWSSKWCWQERLKTHEHETMEIQRNADAVAALEAARRKIERRGVIEDNLWSLAEQLRDKVEAMLRFPLFDKQTVNLPDGTKAIINPGKWTFNTVYQMVSVIKDVGAFAAGMPSVRHEVTGRDGGDLPAVPAGVVLPELHIVVRREADDVPALYAESKTEGKTTGKPKQDDGNGSTFEFSRA
jgi:hypothetical protein